MKLDFAQLHDFATRYTAAWCSRNPESVAAFFSPNGSLKINDDSRAVGRAALTEAARGFMTAFPDLTLFMDDLNPDGLRVEFHWTLEGTHSGPGGTGHKVSLSGFEEWKFAEDGLIEDSLGHFDTADYLHQLQHGIPESAK